MFQEHYIPLLIGYLFGLGGWLLANNLLQDIWKNKPIKDFEKPWKEFGIAILAVLAIIGIGQLWALGIRFPENGTFGSILASINQIFIFAPILLIPLIRGHSWQTAWLPKQNLSSRLIVGFLLGTMAVTVYSLLRDGAQEPWLIVAEIWHFENLDKMVQVFLEDIAIAIVFVRLASAIGNRWATAVVACLFAASHIPIMLSEGAGWLELVGLLRDAGLGVVVILVLQRSKDIVWFWFIHYYMDMTQFKDISGIS